MSDPAPSSFARLRRRAGQLLRNRRGGTAIEYGLIAALITLTMLAAFQGVAETSVALWGNVSNKVATAR